MSIVAQKLQGEAVVKPHLAVRFKQMGIKLETGIDQKNFGRKVQKLRMEKGLTQEDLADAIGVDRSYMGFIERGQRNPTLDKITKIAKALKVSSSELFNT